MQGDSVLRSFFHCFRPFPLSTVIDPLLRVPSFRTANGEAGPTKGRRPLVAPSSSPLRPLILREARKRRGGSTARKELCKNGPDKTNQNKTAKTECRGYCLLLVQCGSVNAIPPQQQRNKERKVTSPGKTDRQTVCLLGLRTIIQLCTTPRAMQPHGPTD